MPRRPRGSAPRRGRGSRSRSRGPWVVAGLVVVALAAVVALSSLRHPGTARTARATSAVDVASGDADALPGIEVPEDAGANGALADEPPRPVAEALGDVLPKGPRSPGPMAQGHAAMESAADGYEPDAGEPAVASRAGARRESAPNPVVVAERRTEAAARAAAPGRPQGGPPRVAIVLDDCGQRLDLMERAVRIAEPLTFAVIPHLPHSRASAEMAHAAGHEVIVHQPMEPEGEDENPGEGVLVTGMTASRVRRTLEQSFRDVPHAAGLNNHMGSRATADARLMGLVLAAVADLGRERPLYFLDSRTSPATVALDAARRAGLRSAQRDVFLDNDLSPAAIAAQLDLLVARAAEQGEAIGIGHLKAETLSVLEVRLASGAPRETRFVFLGDLMR